MPTSNPPSYKKRRKRYVEAKKSAVLKTPHPAVPKSKPKKVGAKKPEKKSKEKPLRPVRLTKNTQADENEMFDRLLPFLKEYKGLLYNQKKFLNTFCYVGSITAAADICNLSTASHYRWTDAAPNRDEYNKAFQMAKNISIEVLEYEARRRAMESSDTLMIFMLKALLPKKYREERVITGAVKHEGKVEHKHSAEEVDIRKIPLDLRQKLLDCLMEDPELDPNQALENAQANAALVEVKEVSDSGVENVDSNAVSDGG